MNSQAFRRQLERAVEQRDQSALDELARLAPESPATLRIWQTHEALERAIEQWRHMPDRRAASLHVIGTTSGACLPTSVTRQRLSRSPAVLAFLLLICCGFSWRLAGGLFTEWREPVEQAAALVEVEESRFPAGPLAVISDQFSRAATERPERVVESKVLWEYSLAMTDHTRQVLPAEFLPTLPDISGRLGEGMWATWDVLATLPTDFQQAWEPWQSSPTEIPAEGILIPLEEVTPREVAPGSAAPPDLQKKRSRRTRPGRPYFIEAGRGYELRVLVQNELHVLPTA